MLSTRANKIIGIIGTGLLFVFVLGLAKSISTGFAGFWGGLPFLLIALFVLGLATYDLYDQCFRKK